MDYSFTRGRRMDCENVDMIQCGQIIILKESVSGYVNPPNDADSTEKYANLDRGDVILIIENVQNDDGDSEWKALTRLGLFWFSQKRRL